MYPLEAIYSNAAYNAWRRREVERSEIDLKGFRQKSREVRDGPLWEVGDFDELRQAVSFLTLMNKRNVLYFRGQGEDHRKCLPILFREEWSLGGRRLPLSSDNRGKYYGRLLEFRRHVLDVAQRVGTPRSYILEHVPAAAASILQHYELWPTHFIDVTRSLSTAIAFAEGNGERERGYLYIFAMPDLRGSVTSDMDQHVTLSRLEAICPPAAKRPHHQDAYLVSRFPEPPGSVGPGDPSWDDWQNKTDLMYRLVAKFGLNLEDGRLKDAPRIALDFLIPPLAQDEFGRALHDSLLPIVEGYLSGHDE